jgi:hypothetical protein
MSVWVQGSLTVVIDYLRRGNLVPAASALVIALFVLGVPRSGRSTFTRQRFQSQLRTSRLPPVVGQNEDADENEVSTDEVEKYVSVYKAMQRNRSLTVDQAAAAQGLTIEQFRQLENRVQRDDAALQQARDELQAAAQRSPTPSGKPVAAHP